MDNKFNELIILSNDIYDCYNNYNKEELNRLLKNEKELYLSSSVDDITAIYMRVEKLERTMHTNELDNFEVVMYDQLEALIIRRILIKSLFYKNLFSSYREYNPNKPIKYDADEVFIINDKIMLYSSIINSGYEELANKLYSNVDIKFLYLLKNSSFKEEEKNKFIHNMAFVDLEIEKKLINNSFNLEKCIKDEDLLYQNLWEIMKDAFNEIQYEFCSQNVNKMISILLSNTDKKDYYTKIRGIYLKTVLSYFDKEDIKNIYRNYTALDDSNFNKKGQLEVESSFLTLQKDKELIKKTKAH